MEMIKDEKLRKILQEMAELLQGVYGDLLKAIILYGSVARGTQTEDSDVDIMVLVDGTDAQLKIVIDRFCAYNSSITRKHMKSALLAVAWNSDDWTFDALVSHYQTLVRYLDLKDQGMVLGRGCGSPAMTRRSRFPEMAYTLGKQQ